MNRATKNLESLAKANARRKEKAEIRRDLKAGRMTLDDLLADLPACCAKTPAFDALQWLPHVGLSTALKVADGVISETVTFPCLGAQTRQQLLSRVRDAIGDRP